MKKNESVWFNVLAPVRRLKRGLGLVSHPNVGVVNSENKLHELVCDYLNHRFDSCTKGVLPGIEPMT